MGMKVCENSYTYTGREWDKETGLYYYRARYYDSIDGRLIQKDPAGFVDGPNLYSYVQSNPVNWTDPTGLSRDEYVPDNSGKHGGPHVDRYSGSENVGRYRPDGTPLKHKGKLSPPIPKSDMCKFLKAAKKLLKIGSAVLFALDQLSL
ncbi:MAG TPA: RHS repeat-associated core domain-containing protein [Bellilinea sp.]|nr:RHS repeat-associated core domain-containing protein [Bellilinea sp.]